MPLCTVIGRCVSAAAFAGSPVSPPCTTDAGRDPARQPRHVDLCPNAQTRAGDWCMLGCVGVVGHLRPCGGEIIFALAWTISSRLLALRTLPNGVHNYVRSGIFQRCAFLDNAHRCCDTRLNQVACRRATVPVHPGKRERA